MDRKIGDERVCSCTVVRWDEGESRTSGKADLVEAVRREGTGTGGLGMTLLVSPDQPIMNEGKWIHTGIVKGTHGQSWPK